MSRIFSDISIWVTVALVHHDHDRSVVDLFQQIVHLEHQGSTLLGDHGEPQDVHRDVI